MRSMLIATVAMVGLTVGAAAMAPAAMAQTTNNDMAPPTDSAMPARPGHMPGDGLSEPTSTAASNISPSDTRSPIAPRLPGSAAPGTSATAGQELMAAQRDLDANRTGAAQEALERAETRLLDRSTAPDMVNTPDSGPMVSTIAQARAALGRHDVAGARSLVAKAMTQTAG
jgi:hypothetical protein